MLLAKHMIMFCIISISSSFNLKRSNYNLVHKQKKPNQLSYTIIELNNSIGKKA